MGIPSAVRTHPPGSIAHLPITLFGAAMGLAGLALAWTRAGTVLDAPASIGSALFWIAFTATGILLSLYTAKVARFPDAVRAEVQHPVRVAFLPTPGIALVLLAAGSQPVSPGLSEILWWVGAPIQLALTLVVISAWFTRSTFTWDHVGPAWFIPVVGLSAAPIAGATIAPDGLSWFFFSAGLAFWVALLPMVLVRLVLHPTPLPPKLLPTLAVLVAPPAVIMLAYTRLQPDPFAGPAPRILFDIALLFALIVLLQAPRLWRAPFSPAWWAYTFPSSALSIAATVMASEYGGASEALAWALLAMTTVVVVAVTARTVRAAVRNEILVPE